ncbi:MAG: response regulator transcription factor [Tunicatimonas sp.]
MRILLIEDEPGISSFLKQGLEEEHYTVDVVTNGNEGLHRALTGEYDLLLVDWMLPGISGVDVCEQLRAQNNHMPLIFLTAKDTVQDTIVGLQAGANDYIKKPFSFDELLERIKVQFRSKGDPSSTLTLGPIRLDTNTYQVFKHEEEITLTHKEFALLEHLLRHRGEVCHRSQIIKDVSRLYEM